MSDEQRLVHDYIERRLLNLKVNDVRFIVRNMLLGASEKQTKYF